MGVVQHLGEHRKATASDGPGTHVFWPAHLVEDLLKEYYNNDRDYKRRISNTKLAAVATVTGALGLARMQALDFATAIALPLFAIAFYYLHVVTVFIWVSLDSERGRALEQLRRDGKLACPDLHYVGFLTAEELVPFDHKLRVFRNAIARLTILGYFAAMAAATAIVLWLP